MVVTGCDAHPCASHGVQQFNNSNIVELFSIYVFKNGFKMCLNGSKPISTIALQNNFTTIQKYLKTVFDMATTIFEWFWNGFWVAGRDVAY